MTRQKISTRRDFEALRRAIEGSDARVLAGLYADDAEVTIVNRNNPPNSPFVLRGKEAIAEYLRTVYGNDTTHRIGNKILGKGRVALNVACEYPDGTRVLAVTTAS